MKLKHIIAFIIFFILSVQNTYACQCPLTVLSLDECSKYEIIFRGRVIKNTTCDSKPGEAIFEIKELFKGKVFAEFSVLYDCGTECASTFNVGEEWIIYTNYKQVDKARMDWCSRSRKFFKNEKEDFYAVTYGNSYDDELVFLRKQLGIYKVMEKKTEDMQGHRNIIPSMSQLIITLIISLAVVVLFLYLFNKFFR